ncbi:MAG: A/G-specific adenine glycosylase [Proteobacteria bacterium]|nr:A/G-specific adenine glycosylase [Pseudomonadota bacterium]
MPHPMSPTQISKLQHHLHHWYNQNHRPMPWREIPNPAQNPYPIWLAEIMLQQTTVAAVIPYYQRFMQTFPTVHALANAPLATILHHWQGLGYYRRAHLLHQCAQYVSQQLNGTFPTTHSGLLALPGIGPYTASVIMATAYNQPATVVDGNVERVIARLFAIATPLPKAKPTITKHAAQLSCHQNPRIHANAVMELGATLCTPQSPKCPQCPISTFCKAYKAKNPTNYPKKITKKTLPRHQATAFLITDKQGNIYLRQRPTKGLLASLWELPHTGLPKDPPTPLPFNLTSHPVTRSSGHPVIQHTFTHFHLTLHLQTAQVQTIPKENRFHPQKNLPPLSTLMLKALKQVLITLKKP